VHRDRKNLGEPLPIICHINTLWLYGNDIASWITLSPSCSGNEAALKGTAPAEPINGSTIVPVMIAAAALVKEFMDIPLVRLAAAARSTSHIERRVILKPCP
jgi:hypothetical protein